MNGESGESGLHRVLYTDPDGHEQVTEAMPYDAARNRARDLEAQGHAVGSVMEDAEAREYMKDRYATEYRGVPVPDGIRDDGVPRSVYVSWKRGVDTALDEEKPSAVDPFAPDLTMSREVADFILRTVNGLLLEGYWPKDYRVQGRHNGDDDEDYDDALLLKAADIVGRDTIKNQGLRDRLADMDVEKGGAS